MPDFEFTKLAEFDLEDIHDQIAQNNPAAALRLLDAIESSREIDRFFEPEALPEKVL